MTSSESDSETWDDDETAEAPPGRAPPLQSIGPYRIEGIIGRGGMGEVYRAFDARLERIVALKRIRRRSGASDARLRERLRREARAVASLNHPSIVQIFDVIESGSEDWLVMEFVEGTTLFKRVDSGPLGEETALSLALEIVAALEVAHAAGIVHRDLKSENILIGTEGHSRGHAKVLDFGLAKRVLAADDATLEPALTRRNSVLGTSRAMSPEQARGEVVDARSDLFSLGTLLYEMVTGTSPFRGESEAQTQSRVCTLRQPRACELAPSLSLETSDLIDRLLEKDPADRPQTAGEVLEELRSIAARWRPTSEPGGSLSYAGPASARRTPRLVLGAAALLVLVAGGYSVWRWGRPAPFRYVAITKPELRTAGAVDDGELLAAGVFAALQQGLAGLRGIAVVAAEDVEPTPAGLRQAAETLAVSDIVRPALACQPLRCEVTLTRLSGADARVLWLQSFEVPTDDFALLRAGVAAQIAEAYPSYPARGPLSSISSESYRSYLALYDAFQRDAAFGDSEAAAELAKLRSESPTFLEAYLLEAAVLRGSFHVSRDPGELRRASELLVAARRLAPRDPRVYFELYETATVGGDWDAAREALEALEEIEPSNAGLLRRRATYAAHLGDTEGALAAMRRAATLQPSLDTLYRLAVMEYQYSESSSARATLETALARVPNSHKVQSLLAQLELVDGSLERAIELYRALIERSEGTNELSNLGFALMLAGEYDQAEEVSRQAYERAPQNPQVVLNLADALDFLARDEEALARYQEVVDLVDASVAEVAWQDRTVRAQALAHLGRPREAVAEVQAALRLQPDNSQTAFEAALVYTLVGDLSSAIVNAERALAAGWAPRFFGLPSFEALRRDPDYPELMSRYDEGEKLAG